jgi:hypothetical protein
MKKISSMPKATLAELILFIAENERFTSVKERLGSGVTVSEVRTALRELAAELSAEAATEGDGHSIDSELTDKTREIIAKLSESEGKRLLAAFGLAAK